MKFEKKKLGDICSISSSKRIFAREYQSEGIPFYRGKEVIEKHNGNDVSSELYISEERYKEIKEKYDVPQIGDVLLTSVGTLGVPWLVNEEKFYFKDGNLTWLRTSDDVENEFLYWWLNSPEAKNQIDAMCIGSTQKALTIDTLKKFQISLPKLEQQKKITCIIQYLQEKIDIDRAVNKNLEEQAKAVVKYYFIDFIPYGGTAPQDWPMVSLNEICEKITDGSHYSPADTPEAPYPMYSVKDMREYGFDASSCKHITAEEMQKMKQNDCVPQMDDILVAKDGSYLKEIFICSATRDEAILSSIAIFRPNRSMVEPEILLYFLKQPSIRKDVGDNYVSGSALPRIVLKDFKKYPVLLPPMDEQHKISDLLRSYRKKIQSNVDEIYRLQVIRDALVPRLISGEIDVSKIEG